MQLSKGSYQDAAGIPMQMSIIQLFSSFLREAARFLILGLIALGLDVLSFTILLLVGVPANISKGVGYALGLVFTLLFIFPRVFLTKSSPRLLSGGVVIYLWSGFVNVWVFDGLLSYEASVVASLISSTAVSASMNFLLLRGLLAFSQRRRR